MILASPDGRHDADILRDGLTNAGGEPVTLYPGATYTLTPTGNDQALLPITANTVLDLNGATIRVGTNPYPKYKLIAVTGGARVTIRGGTLRGDRLTHDYTTTPGTHEFGYGIYVDTATVTVEDVETYDFTGDGVITIDSGQNTTTLRRVTSHHNRRQGVSVLASHTVIIDDCHIHTIGTSDGITGTAPMGGIDLEPASRSQRIDRATIRNTRIDCDVKGVVTSHSIGRLTIDACDIRGQVLHTATTDTPAVVRDTLIEWDYVDQYAVPTLGDARMTGCDLRVNRWSLDGPARDCTFTAIPNPGGLPTRLYITETARPVRCDFTGFANLTGPPAINTMTAAPTTPAYTSTGATSFTATT